MSRISTIPELSWADVVNGTKGVEWGGHSIYDMEDPRLLDKQLHSRVAGWLRSGLTQQQLKEKARAAGCEISGNKKVLALRLAFKNLSTGAGASGAISEVQQELADGGERQSMGVSPVQDPPARTRLASVSILGLEKQYNRLHVVYNRLAARESTIADNIGDADDAKPAGEVSISGVDFAEPLQPLPDDYAFTTESNVNKFAMFVWKPLSACESGSIGGDACRQADVLEAAINDAMNAENLFEHLLGLTLAITNHGIHSFCLRGDPDFGNSMFSTMARAWKGLFTKPEASLGVSAELRESAMSACDGLQEFLKSMRGEGSMLGGHATVYNTTSSDGSPA